MITKTHYLALQDEDVFEDCHDWETEIYFPPEVWFKIQLFAGRDFERKRRKVIATIQAVVGGRWIAPPGFRWIYKPRHTTVRVRLDEETFNWVVEHSAWINFNNKYWTKKRLMENAKANGITKKSWRTKKQLIQALIKL